MKHLVMLAAVLLTLCGFGKAVSTTWNPNPPRHPHGIGLRCPYCSQTWTAIPKGLKAWEIRHLVSERKKYYQQHLRMLHGKAR